MTGELAKHGKAGADILSGTINRVFAPVLGIIERNRGFVSTFAGDALTALFPGAGLPRALDAALHIVSVLDREYVQTSSFGEFTLEAKMGIGEGTVEWGIIENGDDLAGYFRGAAVDSAAQAEHEAGPGQILLPSKLAGTIGTRYRSEEVAASYSRLIGGDGPADDRKRSSGTGPAEGQPAGGLATRDREILKRFVPAELLENELAGEFRTVGAVFIAFADPCEHEAIERIAAPVLGTARQYGGYFNLLDFGDKGGLILVLFGAPRSHGDMPERIAGFVRAVLAAGGEKLRVGFTAGIAFAGFVGGGGRSTYTALGPTVNLAARLGLDAEPGSALTAGDLAASLEGGVEPSGTRMLKGFAAPIEGYRLMDQPKGRVVESSLPKLATSPDSRAETGYEGERFFGREEEIAAIRTWAGPLGDGGAAGILLVRSEAGEGKTSLAATALSEPTRPFDVVWLHADTILRKSLNPFGTFIDWYFHSIGSQAPLPHDPAIEQKLDALAESLSEAAGAGERPLLGTDIGVLLSLLGRPVDGRESDGLDAQGRFERGVDTLVSMISARAAIRPFLIVVDDAHALDADSKIVIERTRRMRPDLPIGILFLSRPTMGEQLAGLLEDAGTASSRMSLKPLLPDAVGKIIGSEVNGPVSRELTEFIIRRVGANPLYVKELAAYLVRRGLLRRGDRGYEPAMPDVPLPEGISSLLLARLDAVAPEVLTVARVAALLGNEFRIGEVEMVLGSTAVKRAMANPDARILWSDAAGRVCRFRQELVRETIQATQLDTALAATHSRIADALAALVCDDPSRYADLAHHLDAAGRTEEARSAFKQAAEYAVTNFKNEKAIEFYQRFIHMAVDRAEKIDAFRALAEIYSVIGRLEEAEEALVFAIGLCTVSGALRRRVELMTKLASAEQRRGMSREAVGVLDIAIGLAGKLEDHRLLASALVEQGRAYWSLGQFDRGAKRLDEALVESKKAKDDHVEGLAWYYRGVVHRDANRYDAALQCYQEALTIFQRRKDDRHATYPLYDMGVVLQYTGATDESRRRFEEVIAVYERIGYRSGMAAAILNLGVLEDRRGNFEEAQRYFAQSRAIADAIGEKLASAYAVFSMGATFYKMHDSRKALYYFTSSYRMFKGLGAKGYYGYPLSYLVCLYADSGKIDTAVRTCALQLRNVQEIGSDVENGRAYLGLATALSAGEPSTQAGRELLGRIARFAKIGPPTADAFFRAAIDTAAKQKYVNTLIPAHNRYARYLRDRERGEEANEHRKRALELATEAKWDRFVSTFNGGQEQ